MIDGVELIADERSGVARISVTDKNALKALSWDRFVRLETAAKAVSELTSSGSSIIDVGGYDGALALFLPDYNIDLIDPATTDASLLNAPVDDGSYELATAIDVLEHIAPSDRTQALSELARIATRFVILNYPCHHSKSAQEVVLKLTNNPLIREHVEWELPDTVWVTEQMKSFGFQTRVVEHTNIAIWLAQYTAQNLTPEIAQELNSYLIEHHQREPFEKPLYHLVVCIRN